ncbi:MAG: hypothetical protein GY751_25520 [Bacteroidetes bacterium]|nr:hypothetical protein [Bacteroidota bacterium]
MTTRRNKDIARDFAYHLSFVLLAILAILFHKERLFGDPSHDLMCVINREWFCLIHDRYILLFSQWLPLTAVLLKLKLKFVLILYSFGHVLFFYILFLISHYHYRDKLAGIIYLLLQISFMEWAYFAFPMSEILYVNGFIVLLTSVVLSTDKPNWYSRIIVLLLLFFILSSHLLSIVTIIMVGLLFYIGKAMTKDPVMHFMTPTMIIYITITGTMGGSHHGPPFISFVEDFQLSIAAIHKCDLLLLIRPHVFIILLTALGAIHLLRRKNHIKLVVLLFAGLMPVIIELLTVKSTSQIPLPTIYKSVFSVIVIMTTTYMLTKNQTGKYLHACSRIVFPVYFIFGLYSIIDSAKYFVFERSVVESVLASLKGSGRDRYILEYNAPVKDPPYQRSLFYSADDDADSARSIRFMQNFDEVLVNKDQLSPKTAGLMIDSLLRADSMLLADNDDSHNMFTFYYRNSSYFKFSGQPPLIVNQNGINEVSKIKRYAKLEMELPPHFSRFRKSSDATTEYYINIHIDYLPDDKPLYSGKDNDLAVKISQCNYDMEPYETLEFPLLSDIYGQGWFPLMVPSYDKQEICFIAELTKNGSSMGVSDTLCLKRKSFGIFHLLYNR